jgi:hypothetical protein
VLLRSTLITFIVNGHWKESKTKEVIAPVAAGSVRDMFLLELVLPLLLALSPTPE